ncbi:MAG: tetratricopeptide repeat protein [Myxococcota bacterium]|jgi:TolA-binding protein|nr:tetratricopeptide repeat protein [Myxococcota bacterium]
MSVIAFGLMVAGLGSGCATARENLARQNEALLREVARLKADKANVQARAAALEDETLMLEKKAQQCSIVPRPALPVVRLEAAQEHAERNPPPEEKKVRSGERPLLSLGASGSGFRQRSSSNDLAGGAPESTLAFGAADGLGVTGAFPAPNVSSDMDQFNEGYRLYANRQFAEALSVLGDFASRSSNHDYADDALFWRAECYLALGKQLRAIGELERLLSRYPSSDKVGSALWRIGNAYDKLGDSTQALGYYFRVVDEFPSTEAARKASQRVAALNGSSAGGRVLRAAAP